MTVIQTRIVWAGFIAMGLFFGTLFILGYRATHASTEWLGTIRYHQPKAELVANLDRLGNGYIVRKHESIGGAETIDVSPIDGAFEFFPHTHYRVLLEKNHVVQLGKTVVVSLDDEKSLVPLKGGPK